MVSVQDVTIAFMMERHQFLSFARSAVTQRLAPVRSVTPIYRIITITLPLFVSHAETSCTLANGSLVGQKTRLVRWRVAHPATPPRRTHLIFRVPACRRQGPILRAFRSSEGLGFHRSVAPTVPSHSYLAWCSDAAHALRPRFRFKICPPRARHRGFAECLLRLRWRRKRASGR